MKQRSTKGSVVSAATAVVAVFVMLCIAHLLVLPVTATAEDIAGSQTGNGTPGTEEATAPSDEGKEPAGDSGTSSSDADLESSALEGDGANAEAGADAELADESQADGDSGADQSSESAEGSEQNADMPEQDLSQKVDLGGRAELEVRIQAKKGVLPKGTKLELKEVTEEDIIDLMMSTAELKAGIAVDEAGIAALNMALKDAKGNVVQPKGKVLVTITFSEIEPGVDFAVVSVKEPEGPDGQPEADIVELKETDPERGQIKFETDAISPYGIVYVPVSDVGSEDADATEGNTVSVFDDGIEHVLLVTPDEEPSTASAPAPIGVPPTEMPAQSFLEDVVAADGSIISVAVDADVGALPRETALQVQSVVDGETIDAAKAEVASQEGVPEAGMQAQAVAIAFTDAEGNPISPATDVHVALVVPDMSEQNQLAVVHVDEAAGAQLIDDIEAHPNLGAAYFDTSTPAVYALVGTTIEQNVLASDGKNYKVSVTYRANAGIPENAQLAVEEILSESVGYGQLKDDTAQTLGVDATSISYARFFDIRIVDGDGNEVQPASGSAVEVKVELADSQSSNLSVVHFGDQAEIVESASLEGTVSFETTGFSVYAIVDAPEPAPIGEAQVASSLDELAAALASNPNEAFYLSVTRGGSTDKYFKNTLNAKDCFNLSDGDARAASKWYFESAGSNGAYRIYTYVGEDKSYVKNTSGNLVGLVENSADATVFDISQAAEGLFYFKVKGQNKWLQYSKGGDGIRFWTDKKDAGNSQIKITYASSLAIEDDPYALDGVSYGIAYHNQSATSAALTASAQTVSGQQRLQGLDMVMRPDVLDNDGILLVAENSDIQFWTFENVEEDNYHITTTVDGAKAYLTIDGGNVTLEDAPDPVKSLIHVSPGTGENAGKWSFSANGYALNLPGAVDKGFNGTSGTGATTWMNLVERSALNDDDFTLYNAKKVSVSDEDNVGNGQQVIVYTRVWNDVKKRYEFYAVDHDGSLVYCYDAGDRIEWIGSKVNTALWEFTEYYDDDGNPNFYYELENVAYGNCIAPQIQDGQILSDDAIGVNLDGRRLGKSSTTIVAWDDYNYEYAGLKVEDGHVVSCPLSEADEFYFAIVSPQQDPQHDELTEVDTIDNSRFGISMSMIDFNNPLTGGRDSRQAAFMGSDGGPGMLSTNLGEDGYPTNASGQSLAELFSPTSSDPMTSANHLFLTSVYNESGYFEYDSTQNFAHLNDDGNFTVYDQLGAITGNSEHKNTREHGQFMPYDDITAGGYAIDSKGNVITNRTDVLGNELPDSNARKGESLYDLGNTTTVDYFFGMEMSASFTQTADGKDAWGHDIIFEFSGDDDFWFYVDGELVLDLGGVHSAQVGSVNFRTGEIVSSNGNSTLYDTFMNNYRARGMSDADIAKKLDGDPNDPENYPGIFTTNANGQRVFKDYSNHTMQMYFMERGAGASNLHMRFNLAAVEPGTFILDKQLSGTDEPNNNLIEFPYQVYYFDENDLDERTPILLGEKTGDNYNVLYEGTVNPVRFAGSFTPAGGSKQYENVFFLKPGESAQVRLPQNAGRYYVVECGVKPDIFDHVLVNGNEIEGSSADGSRLDFATAPESLKDRQRVDYVNHVADGAMRTLSITKKVYDTDGVTLIHYPDDTTPFSFRLYLGDENAASDNLPYASMYSYHVKDADGNYCRRDAASQQFVSLGKSEYELLTDEEKAQATFVTSMYGTISKIPTDHTVEVRNLIVATQYKVEERSSEVPRGYTRRDADGYVRTDVEPDLPKSYPVAGTIQVNEDPQIEVRNQVGWGLTAKKVWTDSDFMQSHDSIYFAVYLGDELVDGSVRQLKTGEDEIYYFFEDLRDNNDVTHRFDEFVVREVTISETNPSVDSDGVVGNPGTVTPIDDGGTLTIGGTPARGAYHANAYTYQVSYDVGESTGRNENVRTDTVTNSRPGIELHKTDLDGNALAGAVFTLKDANGEDVGAVSYTSGTDGLITTAYVPQGTYTLEETKAPRGYVALDEPMTITVDEDDGVEVSGVPDYLCTLDTDNPAMLATITVKDRASGLLVRKVDSSTNQGLSGVHFALYPQVFDTSGRPRKDYSPKPGFEDIVTGSNGVLSGVDMGLGPGTYYLEETQTLPGYNPMVGDLCFTIGENGTVTVEGGEHAGWLETQTDPITNVVSYVITIPNIAGTDLPRTGGVGTLPFLLGGVALVVLSVACLMARRKLACR